MFKYSLKLDILIAIVLFYQWPKVKLKSDEAQLLRSTQVLVGCINFAPQMIQK